MLYFDLCEILAPHGDIAQLGERLHGMQEAVGSSPIISIILRSMINTKKYRKALILLGFAVFLNFHYYIIYSIAILIFQVKDDTKDDTKLSSYVPSFTL